VGFSEKIGEAGYIKAGEFLS